jgi:hypothetical protein
VGGRDYADLALRLNRELAVTIDVRFPADFVCLTPDSRRAADVAPTAAFDPEQKSRGTKPYSGTPAFRRLSSNLSKYDSFMRTNRLRTKPIESAG